MLPPRSGSKRGYPVVSKIAPVQTTSERREEDDRVAVAGGRGHVKQLHRLAVREDRPLRREVGIGRPGVRGRVASGHSVQHVEVRDDRRARVESTRVDRVDDADVAPRLGDRRRASGLLIAAAEHDVPN
jgi:hypothetical protein